jgi:hypothetical protein
MDIFIIVSLCIAVTAFVTAVVFLIKTLVQVRLTARAVEILCENLNREVEKCSTVTGAAFSAASFLNGGMGKAAALIFSFVRSFMAKRKDKFEEAQDERE